MNSETLNQIEKQTKKAPKEELLRTLEEDTIRFLKLACDPMVTFGVTVDEDHQQKGWLYSDIKGAPDWSDQFYHILEQLSLRQLTGNLAHNAVRDCMLRAASPEDVKWACRILNKKLRAGFSATTLNKIWPGLIEEFEVMLATPFEPDKHELLGTWYFEPKLDGLRMIVIDGVAHTRNGHIINSVDEILAELGKYVDLKSFVLDGEIMGAGDFDEASGNIRSKKEGKSDLYYNVFDMLWFREWKTLKTSTTEPFHERRRRLENTIKPSDSVRLVESFPMTFKTPATGEGIALIRDEFIKRGFEGGMGKDANAPYCLDRGDWVYKFKKMETIDARIVDTYEGKGRNKGRLGGVIVEIDGVRTRVGSGFSDDQRNDWWKIRTEIIDWMIEVQFQNKTKDGSLRFPVFIKRRGDKG